MGLAFLVYGVSVVFNGANLSTDFTAYFVGTKDCASVEMWLGICKFVLMLVLISSLGFLAIYDGMYGELPTNVLTFSIICAIIIAILNQTGLFLASSSIDNGINTDVIFGSQTGYGGSLLNLMGAVGILGGVYLVLYVVSKGKWVGDGDWLLGLSLGLALSDVWLALITLLIANLLALAFSLLMPAMQLIRIKSKTSHSKKGQSLRIRDAFRTESLQNHKIYFGPFLVVAFVVVLVFSENLKNMIS